MTKWQLARLVVNQIKNGEWTPSYNPYSKEHLTAERNGFKLWIGNGPFFCDIGGQNVFGTLLRHYVWWAAARKLKEDADRDHYQQEKKVFNGRLYSSLTDAKQ